MEPEHLVWIKKKENTWRKRIVMVPTELVKNIEDKTAEAEAIQTKDLQQGNEGHPNNFCVLEAAGTVSSRQTDKP